MLCKAIYFVNLYVDCILKENPISLPAGIYDSIPLDFNKTQNSLVA